LSEPNTVEFAALYCAGVAGERQTAVLDPAWTSQTREEIMRRLPSPSRAEGIALEDGDPGPEPTNLAGDVTVDLDEVSALFVCVFPDLG
jgi:hypothetical protein